MKTKTLLFTLLTGAFTFFSAQAFAQSTQNEQEQKLEQDSIRDKAMGDKKRLNDLAAQKKSALSDAKVAKANAKEANRIENEASDAAREAKQAARMEAKAQRNRANADKQAKKAAKAVEKSDNN
ncbi:hypothetical protein [Rufibacter tibetensis]|uniref:Uncharacterized protein n=1 Tax=Rufibacter tibetensis TaxID=512763 RepID=A0A0P0CVF7_9BACT|nr:hypothetical protein [Rufibacter tibetensis]ALI98431.1 hypothetical protein DC20_04835 [Rufibacter tibetensis]